MSHALMIGKIKTVVLISLAPSLLTGCGQISAGDSSSSGQAWIHGILFANDGSVVISRDPDVFLRSADGKSSWEITGRILPKDGYIPRLLDDLVEGSGSSVWSMTYYRGGDVVSGVVAVGDLSGESFNYVFDTSDPTAFPSSGVEAIDVIAMSEADPLLLDWAGQLWMHSPEEAGENIGAFLKVGSPLPNLDASKGVSCGGRLNVVSAGVWKSDDLGENWEIELQETVSTENVVDFACTEANALWMFASREIVYRREPGADALSEFMNLSENEALTTSFGTYSITSQDESLLLLGYYYVSYAELVNILIRIDSDGTVETLPAPPRLSTLVKVDPQGAIWAAGTRIYRLDETQGEWEQRWP